MFGDPDGTVGGGLVFRDPDVTVLGGFVFSRLQWVGTFVGGKLGICS